MSDYRPPLVNNTEAWNALDKIRSNVSGELWGEIELATRTWDGDGFCHHCHPVRIIGWYMIRIENLIYNLTYDGDDERLSREEIFTREIKELRRYADQLSETGLDSSMRRTG